jgi:high-affinity K+ transport system ATPase subunit B
MFTLAIPQMEILNIMGLSTPQSAILSALIFTEESYVQSLCQPVKRYGLPAMV